MDKYNGRVNVIEPVNQTIQFQMQERIALKNKSTSYSEALCGNYEYNSLGQVYFSDKNIKKVKPDFGGIFEWIYVIENAKEIHCMDSSFIVLVDCLSIDKKIPLYNHRYVRKYPDFIKIESDKDWNFIQ